MTDFSAGTPDSTTYVAETTNGEVILKPTVGTEFSTPGLPADWFVQEWAPAGAATVAQGLVAVDGALIGQNGLYEAGRSLEFVATFSDDLQHIGFGIDFSTQPWAIFGTVLNRVYARTNNGTTNISTPLGVTLFGSPHRYRIQWTTSGVTYFVDDVEVASHAVSITAPMRPLAASDYTLSGAQLKNDWFRMSPYAATGTFVSRVFDAGDSSQPVGRVVVDGGDAGRHQRGLQCSDRSARRHGHHLDAVEGPAFLSVTSGCDVAVPAGTGSRCRPPIRRQRRRCSASLSSMTPTSLS